MNKSLTFSIVIPTYNEAENIIDCLNAIFDQTVNSVDFEIIVSDDASSDMTINRVRDFEKTKNIKNIRVISSQENTGRFANRLRGVNAAKFPQILLIDAKIRLAPNTFSNLQKINYSPVMGTHQKIIYRSVLDHLYFLIRRKKYFKQFPKVPGEFIYIDESNFSRCPKGTGDFLCAKELLLKSVPANVGPHSSDDTAWISNIMKYAKIMIHNEFEVLYWPRSGLTESLIHLFNRGPKFLDYYGASLINKNRVIILMVVSASTLLLAFTTPLAYLLNIFCVVILINILSSCYLARNPLDFLYCFILLPIVESFFCAGLLWGLACKLIIPGNKL